MMRSFSNRAPLRSSRRAVLGGLLGLAALPAFCAARARAADPTIPKRFVVFHVPEGVPVDDADIFGDTPDYFWPNSDLSQLPRSSAALSRHRPNLTFLKGLNFFGSGEDRHVQGMEDLLTGDLRGAPTRQLGNVSVPGGRSIDQILGDELGQQSIYRSYGLGILNHLEGVKEKRRLSYAADGQGLDVVNDPLRAFDDLLGNVVSAGNTGPSELERRLRGGKSVLDSLTRELERERCRLGADGRSKLEHFASSVRSIESRIEMQLSGAGKAVAAPERPADKGGSSYWSDLANAPEIGELQARTAVAALSADVTRVVVLQWNQSVNRQTYPWLPVLDKSMGGHDYAHASALKGDPPLWAEQRAIIFEWYLSQLAVFLDLLAETKEVDGSSLLDHTAVLYCSEMGHGHHSGSNLPFILAGTGGGAFKSGGRRLDFASRPHNDLLATILHAYGLTGASIGRAEHNKGLLNEILA